MLYYCLWICCVSTCCDGLRLVPPHSLKRGGTTISTLNLNNNDNHSHTHGLHHDRRAFVSTTSAEAMLLLLLGGMGTLSSSAVAKYDNEDEEDDKKMWKGTSLPLMSPEDAATYLRRSDQRSFPMARWPDPVLRIPSVPTPENLDPDDLRLIANALRNTCRANEAVGLASQQCGVHMSLIYLDDVTVVDNDNNNRRSSHRFLRNITNNNNNKGLFLVNPRMLKRSAEPLMQIWTESCLVLPPSFQATVLRDGEVLVEAEDVWTRDTFQVWLKGDAARTLQHECDHDRGILITDHVDLSDLTFRQIITTGYKYNMKDIEGPGHYDRQRMAYDRYIGPVVVTVEEEPQPQQSDGALYSSIRKMFIPDAYADEERPRGCDDACQQRLLDRRALMRQGRSSTSRQEVLDLSRQRAAMYNTTYQGTSCIPGLPCY